MTVLMHGMLSPTLLAASSIILPVVNPVSGAGRAHQMASGVLSLAQSEGLESLPALETEVSFSNTVSRIAERIDQFRAARPGDTLDVIAFGGDGTISQAMQGALSFLFSSQSDLFNLPEEQVVNRMIDGGIRIGAIAMGSVNDLGMLIGSPSKNERVAVDYLKTAIEVPLNLGAAHFPWSGETMIFSHNVSAGEAIAGLFKDTQGGHGRSVHLKRNWVGFRRMVLQPKHFGVQWTRSNGDQQEFLAREVLNHGTPLANRVTGFPGRPLAGLGTKVLPHGSLLSLVRMYSECNQQAKRALRGNPGLLAADKQLTRMPLEFQAAVAVGEEIRYVFVDTASSPIEVPVQIDGDYIRDANQLWVRALPNFPYFLMSRNCLLHQLYVINRS